MHIWIIQLKNLGSARAITFLLRVVNGHTRPWFIYYLPNSNCCQPVTRRDIHNFLITHLKFHLPPYYQSRGERKEMNIWIASNKKTQLNEIIELNWMRAEVENRRMESHLQMLLSQFILLFVVSSHADVRVFFTFWIIMNLKLSVILIIRPKQSFICSVEHWFDDWCRFRLYYHVCSKFHNQIIFIFFFSSKIHMATEAFVELISKRYEIRKSAQAKLFLLPLLCWTTRWQIPLNQLNGMEMKRIIRKLFNVFCICSTFICLRSNWIRQ